MPFSPVLTVTSFRTSSEITSEAFALVGSLTDDTSGSPNLKLFQRCRTLTDYSRIFKNIITASLTFHDKTKCVAAVGLLLLTYVTICLQLQFDAHRVISSLSAG